MAPTPGAPGAPGVTIHAPVPNLPTEQDATSWSIGHGKLIAAIIVTVCVATLLKFLWRSAPVKILITISITLFVGYLIWG